MLQLMAGESEEPDEEPFNAAVQSDVLRRSGPDVVALAGFPDCRTLTSKAEAMPSSSGDPKAPSDKGTSRTIRINTAAMKRGNCTLQHRGLVNPLRSPMQLELVLELLHLAVSVELTAQKFANGGPVVPT